MNFTSMPQHPNIKMDIRPVYADQIYIDQLNNNKDNILGVVEFRYNKEDKVIISEEIPYCHVNMSPYFEKKNKLEVWVSSRNVLYGKHKNFTFATSGNVLFGCVSLSGNVNNLDIVSEKMYDELFHMTKKLGYPYLYRIWNYFPDINKDDCANLERYKSFCYGRAKSFEQNNEHYPAATGIGSMDGNFNIYFLSSSNPNYKNIENPRQTPAYNYPPKYGPKPPSFSRATYIENNNNVGELYISGTASIIESSSIHFDDISKQCNETLKNIQILISKDNLKKYDINKDLSLKDIMFVKVYVRRVSDFEIVKQECEKVFSPIIQIMYLQADVCRSELLVEIEGIIYT